MNKSFYASFILLLTCSTILAIAGIRGFFRLAPAIEQINDHNTQSLYITEQMISALTVKKDIKLFEQALKDGKLNITEKGEAEIIKKIENNYKAGFRHPKYKETIVNNIIELSHLNRLAMKNAALQAKRLSSAATWIITFLIIITWVLGIFIMHTLAKNIIKPLAELTDVLNSYSKGNTMRRCPKLAPNQSFQKIYDNINDLLDKNSKFTD